jgi:4-hydroxybenzoate polyprenyltransferase
LKIYNRISDDVIYSAFTGLRYLKNIILSMRIKQWYKNILLFAPIAFSGNLANTSMWKLLVPAFVCFCLLSSVGYIINDLKDKDKDKLNEHKKERPIASGKLSYEEATIIAVVLAILILIACWYINANFFYVSLAYLAITISYTFIFKQIVLTDIIVIGLCFVLRAIAGSIVLSLELSEWMIICVFLLALFLALNKRWYSEKGAESFYSISILNKLISITTASLLASYFIYVILDKNYALLVSIIFVVYGLYRYIYLVQHLNHKAESENMLTDKPMLISIVCWIACIATLTVKG